MPYRKRSLLYWLLYLGSSCPYLVSSSRYLVSSASVPGELALPGGCRASLLWHLCQPKEGTGNLIPARPLRVARVPAEQAPGVGGRKGEESPLRLPSGCLDAGELSLPGASFASVLRKHLRSTGRQLYRAVEYSLEGKENLQSEALQIASGSRQRTARYII